MVPSGGATQKKSPVTPPGIDPGTVVLVAQCLNHYATPGGSSAVHIYTQYTEQHKTNNTQDNKMCTGLLLIMIICTVV